MGISKREKAGENKRNDSGIWFRGQEKRSYIFDIRTRVNRDHIAMFDAQVVADDAIQAGTAVIELIVGQHDEHGVLALFPSD